MDTETRTKLRYEIAHKECMKCTILDVLEDWQMNYAEYLEGFSDAGLLIEAKHCGIDIGEFK